MLDLIFISALIANMSAYDAFTTVDAYVEANTNYTYFYWARNMKDYLNDSRGDCTDKALLKCHLLRQRHIQCGTVGGYVNNIQEPKYKHAWILANINGTWVSSEPQNKVLWSRIR